MSMRVGTPNASRGWARTGGLLLAMLGESTDVWAASSSLGAFADSSPVAEPGSAGIGWWVGLIVLGLVGLGIPLFAVLGGVAVFCLVAYAESSVYGWAGCLSLSSDARCGFDGMAAQLAALGTNQMLLAIALFIASGAIMSAGDTVHRIVALARALLGGIAGRSAVATVVGSFLFALLCMSGPIIVLTVGALMVPALVKAGYPSRFPIGLVAASGTLGLLIPPSIPMVVFAVAAGGRVPLDVGELFIAGIGPGLLIAGLFGGYGLWFAWRKGDIRNAVRAPWSSFEVVARFRRVFWALLLPVIVVGGIVSRVLTVPEAAALSVAYALLVELVIYRQIGVEHLPRIFGESAMVFGALLIVMALALGLHELLMVHHVPGRIVDFMASMNLGPLGFLLLTNLVLLAMGMLAEPLVVIVLVAPVLKPIADQLGIDPVHLGAIVIVNLQIACLLPPMGINLRVGSAAFHRPVGEVARAAVPFVGLMLIALGVVTYVPALSVGPVNMLLRDRSLDEPLPSPHEGTGSPGASPVRLRRPAVAPLAPSFSDSSEAKTLATERPSAIGHP